MLVTFCQCFQFMHFKGSDFCVKNTTTQTTANPTTTEIPATTSNPTTTTVPQSTCECDCFFKDGIWLIIASIVFGSSLTLNIVFAVILCRQRNKQHVYARMKQDDQNENYQISVIPQPVRH